MSAGSSALQHLPRIVACDPVATPNPALAAAAARAGALGVLDIALPGGTLVAQLADHLHELSRNPAGPVAVRLPWIAANQPGPELPSEVEAMVFTGRYRPSNQDVSQLPQWLAGRLAIFEVTSLAEAEAAIRHGAQGLIAKGSESGGRVGNTEAFVLCQQIARLDVPFWLQGGIGEHTCAAAIAAGATGVVLDSQLALVTEAELPEATRRAVTAMDGSETRVIANHRVYVRPDLPAASIPERVTPRQIARRLGGDILKDLVPLGQHSAAAAHLAKQHVTTGGVIDAIGDAITAHLRAARAHRPFTPGSRLARRLGTRYPVVQGPMTRVSDRPELAGEVADHGGLPFLALSVLNGADTHELLTETKSLLGDRPWGVGLLGFAPAEVREAQLKVVKECRPPVALLAGGRPAQARTLEEQGIRTFLHVPSSGLLAHFLADGARRFVFEGRECGGHVGPRASLPLWDAQVRQLLSIPDPEKLEVLFAGGIHDAMSAAMVATVAAPLAARGAATGVLMGTAYLFTEEAVSSGALSPTFQEVAKDCQATVLLETAPGHSTRCADSQYARTFQRHRAELEAKGLPSDAIWAELESLNLGRLRIASKALARQGDDLVRVDERAQHAEGMFMIGQVAALRHTPTTIARLHDEVSSQATSRIQDLAETALPEPQPVKVAAELAEPAGRGNGSCDIAVVGMAGVFPGATDLEAYWANVLAGRDCTTEIPAERWDPSRLPAPVVSHSAGLVPWIPFDALRYGIPPRSLASIEPVQLLSLEVAAQALQDAGYRATGETGRDFERDRTAVVFGTEGGNELAQAYGFRINYQHLIGPLPPELDAYLPAPTEDSFPGVLTNIIAGRIANRLDLGGPNLTVDAACASSLAAVDAARKELLCGDSDMVLCGAADTHNSLYDYELFSAVHALSPSGRCRPFDADADGIVLGEGVACLVLKRLDDARRDGDRIHAVIEGIGSASDGRQLGLTAPRQRGQVRALRQAFEQAGATPASAGLIEAHGTGTVVGDRTELSSLTAVLDEDPPAGSPPRGTVVGSVKSQIGHTKCAAGLAGVIKVARALRSGVLPPTGNITAPNQAYDPATSPMELLDQPTPWPEVTRRAGVSAFGFGGTNFHVVMRADEESPRPLHGLAEWPAELLLIRGADEAEAASRLRELQGLLSQIQGADPAGTQHRLRDLAWAVCASGDGPVQVAIVATDLTDLDRKLTRALSPGPAGTGVVSRTAAVARQPKVAFLHPGQGSQRPGMLRDLFVAFPRLQEQLAHGEPWVPTMFPPAAYDAETRTAQGRSLSDTRVAQPALALTGLAATDLLRSLALAPDFVAGHSFGELVALTTAQALSPEALIMLSAARGEAMAQAADDAGSPGAMAAVNLSLEQLKPVLDGRPDLVVANHNSPSQCVVSGPRSAVEALVADLVGDGIGTKLLPVSAAFHSPLVAPACKSFADCLAATEVRSPAVPTWAGALAAPYPSDPERIKDALARQLTEPIRFVQQIESMYAAGARVFIEAGPGKVLTQLVGRILGDRPHLAVSCDAPGEPGLPHLLLSLAKLAAAGVPVDTEPLFAGRAQPLALSSLPVERPGWSLSGHLVCTSNGEPLGRGLRPATQIPEVTMTDTHRDGRSNSTDAVHRAPNGSLIREYLAAMRELADAQRQVMLRYLGDASVPDNPASEPRPESDMVTPRHSAANHAAPSGNHVAAGRHVAGNHAAPVPLPTPPPAPSRPSRDQLMAVVTATVADRTGYPTDMLEPSLDLEADLSIDSIKRLELLSDLADRLPQLGTAGSVDDSVIEQLAACKTLDAIVDQIHELPDGHSPTEPSIQNKAAPPTIPVAARRMVLESVAAKPAGRDARLRGKTVAIVSGQWDGLAELSRRLEAAGASVHHLGGQAAAGGEIPADERNLLERADVLMHLGGLRRPQPDDARAVFRTVQPALAGRCQTFFAAVGLVGDDPVASSTGIGGLMRALAVEAPGACVRSVELGEQANDPAGAARLLTSELLDTGSSVSVSYRAGGRTTRTLGKAAPLDADPPVPPLSPGSVVVVTGGGRGITARCAVGLAQATSCRVELLGRSPLPPPVEDPATAGAPDLPSLRRAVLADVGSLAPAQVESRCQQIMAAREIRATLRSFDQLNVPATYHAVDVRDTDALTQTLATIRQRHGHIDAVIHGAGIVEDALALNKSADSFDRVFGTKAVAARTLLENLDEDTRTVVLFGSISGVLGNHGQLDYSAANDALGSLASHYDGQEGRRVLCVHWGPWAGDEVLGRGMVSPELERSYAQRGVGLLHPDEGINGLLHEMSTLPGEPAEVVIMRAHSMSTVSPALRPAVSGNGTNGSGINGSTGRDSRDGRVTLEDLTLPTDSLPGGDG